MQGKFAIIGCQHAHIGIFIKEMLAMGYTCAGICELDNVHLAERLAEQYHVPLAQERDVLLDDSIAIVGCASINNEKIDIIERCEQYGKHVMIDKPAVTNAEDLERLKEVVNRGRIQVGMLLTERCRSSIFTLKKMIEQGELGEIVNIAMRKPHRLTPENRPKWHFSKQQNGGIIIDLLIHDFDLLRWLTDQEIVGMKGYMAKNILPEYPDFYDCTSLQVIMENQLIAQLYADWHNPQKSWTWGDCRIYVTGTKGVVEIRLEGDPLFSKDELMLCVTDDKEFRRIELEQQSECFTVTEDFLNRIDGKPAMISHRDIIMATQAAIMADQSVEILTR